MTPPQVNATLTKVEGPAGGGTVENFDGPRPAGPTLWEGSEPVYFRQVRDRSRGAEGGDIVATRELIVGTSLGIDWKVGTVATFIGPGGVAQSGSVKVAAIRDLEGVPDEVRTTKLTLEAG